ncbi:hypothetical protein GCM10020218_100760 [Dactylosporangium vinaceum]
MEAHLARLRDLTLATARGARLRRGAPPRPAPRRRAPRTSSAAVVEPWLREALTKARATATPSATPARAPPAGGSWTRAGRSRHTVIEGVYHLDGDALADFATAVLPKLAGEGAVASFLGEVHRTASRRSIRRDPAFLARERDGPGAVGSIAAAAEKGEEAVRLAARSGDRLELSAALDDQGRAPAPPGPPRRRPPRLRTRPGHRHRTRRGGPGSTSSSSATWA